MSPQPPTIPATEPTTTPAETPQTSGLAIGSLVCGVGSLFTLILTGIPAVICGHMALGRIKRSQGNLGGNGMAIAGLIMGYLSILLTLLIAPLAAIATPVILKQQKKAELTQTTSNAKLIFLLLIEYDQGHGEFPKSLEQLVDGVHISPTELDSLLQHKEGEWQYFPPAGDHYSSNRIILASPKPINGKWVALRADGAALQMLDADYQAAIKAQQQP